LCTKAIVPAEPCCSYSAPSSCRHAGSVHALPVRGGQGSGARGLAYHSVGSLPCAGCFIDHVINLSWDSFTTHPKDGTFPSYLKVHRHRLEGVVGVVDLLGKVKEVVDTNRPTPRWHIGANRRRGVASGKVLLYCIFAFLHHNLEVQPLTHCPQEVSLSCFQCLRVR